MDAGLTSLAGLSILTPCRRAKAKINFDLFANVDDGRRGVAGHDPLAEDPNVLGLDFRQEPVLELPLHVALIGAATHRRVLSAIGALSNHLSAHSPKVRAPCSLALACCFSIIGERPSRTSRRAATASSLARAKVTPSGP